MRRPSISSIVFVSIFVFFLFFGCAGVQIPKIPGINSQQNTNINTNASIKTEPVQTDQPLKHTVGPEPPDQKDQRIDVSTNNQDNAQVQVQNPVQCFKEVDRKSVAQGTPIGTSNYPYCACIGYDGVIYSNLTKFPSTTRCTCTNTPKLSYYVQSNQICPGQSGSGQANLFYYDGTANVQTSSTASSTAPSTSTSSTSASTGSSGGTTMSYQQFLSSKDALSCDFTRKTFSGKPLKSPVASKLYKIDPFGTGKPTLVIETKSGLDGLASCLSGVRTVINTVDSFTVITCRAAGYEILENNCKGVKYSNTNVQEVDVNSEIFTCNVVDLNSIYSNFVYVSDCNK